MAVSKANEIPPTRKSVPHKMRRDQGNPCQIQTTIEHKGREMGPMESVLDANNN